MLKPFTAFSKSIPLDDSWEVIVVGGGPAGCAAAAAAAREGARTLLIEGTGALGGMGTSGLVPAWCPFSDKEKLIYQGMGQRVMETLKSQMPHVKPEMVDWVPIDAERLKVVYDELVTGYGAAVLFHTMLSTVETDEDGRVTGIIVTNKSGLTAFQAKVYVDCTGDADLAAWAGGEYSKGDAQGSLQPATHCFILGNVDEYAYLNGPNLHNQNKKSPIYEIAQSGEYPLIPDAHLCNNLVAPRATGFNAGHIWEVDHTDPWNTSKAMVQGRAMAQQYRDALAKHHPRAFANSYVASTGALMGIRETRRIMGDYMLTLEDYLNRQSFPDEICRNNYYIDIHFTEEEAKALLEGKLVEKQRSFRYGPGESHGIPYGCLTPKGLANVLVAGRSISCERAVQGSVRVMPVCLATGEAAGLAAAMTATTAAADVHAVDVSVLRSRLKEAGAYLPDQS